MRSQKAGIILQMYRRTAHKSIFSAVREDARVKPARRGPGPCGKPHSETCIVDQPEALRFSGLGPDNSGARPGENPAKALDGIEGRNARSVPQTPRGERDAPLISGLQALARVPDD